MIQHEPTQQITGHRSQVVGAPAASEMGHVGTALARDQLEAGRQHKLHLRVLPHAVQGHTAIVSTPIILYICCDF